MGDLQSKRGRHKGLRSRKYIDLLFHKFTFSSKLMKGQQEPENHFGSWLYNYITLLPKDITPHLCISWASYQRVIEKVFHVMDTAPDRSDFYNPNYSYLNLYLSRLSQYVLKCTILGGCECCETSLSFEVRIPSRKSWHWHLLPYFLWVISLPSLSPCL